MRTPRLALLSVTVLAAFVQAQPTGGRASADRGLVAHLGEAAFAGRDSQNRLWVSTDHYDIVEGEDCTFDFRDKAGTWRVQSLGRSALRYSSGEALVSNLSMLGGDCEHSPPVGWSWYGAKVTRSEAQHFEGSASLRVATSPSGANLASAYFPVKAGADYEISLAHYDESAIPYDGRTIYVLWVTAEGVVRGHYAGRLTGSVGAWKTWSHVARAPLGVTRACAKIFVAAGGYVFYVDDLRVEERVALPSKAVHTGEWGPYLQGSAAWFGFERIYQDLTETHSFRVDRSSPVVDWHVQLAYHAPLEVREEKVGFHVPVGGGLVLARDLALKPLSEGGTYYSEQHTTHGLFFPGGPCFPGFDSFDSMEVQWAGGGWDVSFYTDYWENHPFAFRVFPSDQYVDSSLIARHAGETRAASVQFLVGQGYFPIVLSREPFCYEATLGLTEHPDGGTYPGNMAVAYGCEDPTDPDFGNTGILGHGLVWTKAVWVRADSRDAISMQTPGVLQLYTDLAERGVEICPHTPTDVSETTEELAANLAYFVPFGSRNFIYHNTNLEALHLEGAIPGSPYYSLAALGEAGYKYAYWRDVNPADDELNILIPAQPSWVTPVFWHHNLIEDPAFPGVPILWPTINLMHAPEIWLRPENADRLVAQRGVCFTHSYFGAPQEQGHAWYVVGGKARIYPAFELALSHIADLANQGRLWVTTVSQAGDFMTALRDVHASLDDGGSILLYNGSGRRLCGLTLMTGLSIGTARLDGARILSTAGNRLTIPVLAPGLHTLRIEYGAPESSERIETDFPAVAFSWDELGLRGVVSGDAGGLRRVTLHIPSLSGKDAVWTDVSSGVPQQVSFDGNGTAVVNADFGVFRSCREFSLVALPIVDVPQVEIVEPHEGAVLKSGVAVRAAVSGGVADYVELLVDGVSVGQVSASPYEWGWNTAEVSVVEGPHVLTAAAHGAYGTSQASISVSVDNATFDDVPKFAATWQHVEALAGAGITTGCSRIPPLYCPYGGATRAQMAVFLCRAAGKGPLYAETPTFSDVPKANAYYGWIERLADAESWGGLSPTDGCGRQGTQRYFCPDSPVTRGQVAKFLCRATGKSEMPSCSGMFVDVPAGSESCAYVERLAVGGSWPGGVPVTCGCGGSGATRWYCPSSPLTREQLAVFICRAFGISM